MTEAVQVALIITVPNACLGAATLLLSWRNGRKARETQEKVDKNTHKVEDLHVAVNSRLTELLELTAVAAETKGKLLEKERSKAEHANVQVGVTQEKERMAIEKIERRENLK
jgi:hypothetical protein